MSRPIEDNDPLRFAFETESQYFDRKSARKDPTRIAKHLCAFANASGGKLVIGIEDHGEITGFKRSGACPLQSFLDACKSTCSPTPTVVPTVLDVVNSSGEDDHVLVLDIHASPDRVIARRQDGAVFLREDDASTKLTPEQALALRNRRGE